MSIHVKNDLGTWRASTASNNLGVSQTHMAASLFLKVNKFTTTGISTCFRSGGIQIRICAGFIQVLIFGVTKTQIFAIVPTLGATYHVGFSHDASGTSRIYLDRVVVSSLDNIGAIPSSASQVIIGLDTLNASDVEIEDAAVCNGSSLTAADFYGLASRTLTPATTSVPFTSWWTLGGSLGTNPAAGDAGLHDQLGPNNLITVPGVGGITTNAVYGTTLNFTPILTSDVRVRYSGNIIAVGVGTNPALGASTPIPITALNGAMTFKVNGVTPATIQGPYWATPGHNSPLIHYHVAPPVGPDDVVTWAAADNFAVTTGNNINYFTNADSGTATNYVGRVEPGRWGYLGSDMDDADKHMEVGFNSIQGVTGPTVLVKNIARTFQRGWGGAVTQTADGYPLTAGASGQVFQGIWHSDVNNGIDNRCVPTPTGTWTAYGDESNPGSPTTASMRSDHYPAGIHAPVITPGTIVDGVERDKKWEIQVDPNPDGTGNLGLLWLFHTASGGAGPITVTNLRLYEPGQTPVATLPDPLTANDNFARMIEYSPGVFAPILRNMQGSAGYSSIVRASDFPSATALTFAPPPIAKVADWIDSNPTLRTNRELPIYSVSAYDLAVYPHVFLTKQYLRSVPSTTGYGDYMYTPASVGDRYDWPYKTGVIASTTFCTAVIKFAKPDGTPVPHNLTAGQFVSFPSTVPPVPMANINGSGTVVLANHTPNVWPVSDHEVVAVFGSSSKPDATMGNTVGTTIVNVVGTALINGNGGMWPTETFGAVSRSTGNSAVWWMFGHAMTDDAIRADLQKLHDSTNRGTRIMLECSNEAMIPNPQYEFFRQLAGLEGLNNLAESIARRANEAFLIAEDVWGADAGSLIRIMQVWAVNPTITTRFMLPYCHANSFKIDGISFGPYPDISSSPTYTMAAASIVAGDPRSIAHTGGPGGTPLVPLPMAGWHDITEDWFAHDLSWMGPTGFIAAHNNEIDRAGYGQGGGTSGFRYPRPKLYFYEAATDNLIPPGVSLTDPIVRTGLTHDAIFHPGNLRTKTAMLRSWQQAGPAGSPGATAICIEALCGLRGFGGHSFTTPKGPDGLFAADWSVYTHARMLRGTGESNQFWATDGKDHDAENESVSGEAYARWTMAKIVANTIVANVASADGFTFVDSASAGRHIGRVRRGDVAWLTVSITTRPDGPPVAVVLDADSNQMLADTMPASDRLLQTFELPILIGNNFPIGSFTVYFHYSLAGVSTLQTGGFEVIPGGDSGGSVISMHALDRAEARSVVAQLAGGQLVLGRNPAGT